jgi:tetratricopeptide (TPR) repeat protein
MPDALPLLEESQKLLEEKLGPAHPKTLDSMGNLANAYLSTGHTGQALAFFDRFIDGRRKRAAPEDPGFARLLAAVSLDLLQHRQYPAAETYLRECLTIREKTLPDDWMLYDTKSMLGGALAGQKKFQEAEPLLVEGYSGIKERDAKIPPAAKTRLNETIRRLVDLYAAWEKPAEAEKWREQLERATKD